MKILSNKKLPIALHVLAWGIIILIPRYLINTYGGGNSHFLYHFYTNTAIYGLLFYINYRLLVPRLYLNEKHLQYFLSAAGLIILLSLLMWYFNDFVFFDKEREEQIAKVMNELNKGKDVIKPPIRQFMMYEYFFTSVLICGFSLGLGVLEKLTRHEKERKELEKERLNSELAYLKNQISPHFFFNTLNNIYSLIGIDASEAREAVLKLSKLMRYLLYDSEQGKVMLSDEIGFLTHYIDLMKLRLNHKVGLSVALPENFTDLGIPPLLFIPFVENAFKHGVSNRGQSFIDIKMTVDGTQISLIIKNSIAAGGQHVEGQHTGIGLENVQKRLKLLFPGKHHLKIVQTNDDFMVELHLETKS